jgi:fumarate hydratase, class II
MSNALSRIGDALPRLLVLPQGGTAAGTGLNAPERFDDFFCATLAEATGLPFEPSVHKFEGMAAHDALVELSGALNTIATSLLKIANDIRLLASGPRCGLGELRIPDDGLTSSIMPGKRNPTIAEVLVQACFQVIGNHQTITVANASGNFELNVAKPVLVYNLLQSLRVLADSVSVFSRHCVRGIDVDREQLKSNVERSLLAVTALNPILGYDRVAQITATASRDRVTPRTAAIALGFLDGDEYDRLLDPKVLAVGNVSKR